VAGEEEPAIDLVLHPLSHIQGLHWINNALRHEHKRKKHHMM
jgi:hypothetical protein